MLRINNGAAAWKKGNVHHTGTLINLNKLELSIISSIELSRTCLRQSRNMLEANSKK